MEALLRSSHPLYAVVSNLSMEVMMTARTTTRPLVVRLSDELSAKLSEEARSSGRSSSAIVAEALAAYTAE